MTLPHALSILQKTLRKYVKRMRSLIIRTRHYSKNTRDSKIVYKRSIIGRKGRLTYIVYRYVKER
jgi:hypothetical protein